MMHVFWALLSGQLLPSRGALFPALKAIGLEDEAVRRAWTAISSGVWQIAQLIEVWRRQVESLAEWKRHEYEGYKPVTADVTAFWRPSLKNCPSKHYHPAVQHALPAVILASLQKSVRSMDSELHCQKHLNEYSPKTQMKSGCGASFSKMFTKRLRQIKL